MYWFFIPLHSHNKHIRRFFLAYNSLLVFPLTAPIAPTLLGLLATMAPVILLILLRIWIALAPLPSPTIVARFIIVVVASTIGVYVLPMVFYIYSTEQIIRLNVLEDEDEGNWSYGQTLALITALMSVVMLGSDIVKLARILRNRPDNVESAETRAESGVLGKPQGIGPSSSAVSLRDVEVTVRRTGTNATSL
ncbi:hypothetical protein VNI00_006620 [Paramarasmius palmivorus]|uniref:Uncharacterized protein n=1 Tax=Paramarasmius palmivorus TaxID=297713 RepID=A0AAW0D8G5_9AGAR